MVADRGRHGASAVLVLEAQRHIAVTASFLQCLACTVPDIWFSGIFSVPVGTARSGLQTAACSLHRPCCVGPAVVNFSGGRGSQTWLDTQNLSQTSTTTTTTTTTTSSSSSSSSSSTSTSTSTRPAPWIVLECIGVGGDALGVRLESPASETTDRQADLAGTRRDSRTGLSSRTRRGSPAGHGTTGARARDCNPIPALPSRAPFNPRGPGHAIAAGHIKIAPCRRASCTPT